MLKKWIAMICSLVTVFGSMAMGAACGNNVHIQWGIEDITDSSVPEAYDAGFGNGVTFTYSGPDNWYAPASLTKNLEVWKEAEKRTGVKIKWEVKVSKEWNDSMMMKINSGAKLPDIIGLPIWQNADIDRFSREKVILPLNELINKYAPNIKRILNENPEIRKQMTAADGGIYSIDEVFMANEYYKSIIIRKDWLLQCGYAEDWVPETKGEFTEVLTKFKTQVTTKYQNQGVATMPMIVVEGDEYEFLASAFGLSVPLQNTVVDKDGNAVYQRATDEYGQFLGWMQELYKANLISQDYETGSRTNMEMLIAKDQVGMTVAEGDIMDKYNKLLASNQIDGEYIMINPPVDGKGELALVKRPQLGGQIGITADCSDPVTAIRWIDYLWGSEEGNILLHYGIEGKSYTTEKDGTLRLTDFVLDNPDGLDPASALRTLGAWGPLFDRQTKEFLEAFYPRQVVELVAKNVEKGLYKDPFPKILGTREEMNATSSIAAAIDTYQSENSMLFILGARKISEYGDYQKDLLKFGLRAYEQARKEQYERYRKL